MPITTPPAMEQHSHDSAAKPVAYAKIAGNVRTGQRLIRLFPNLLSLTAKDQIRLVLNGLEKTEKSLVLSVFLASHDAEPLPAGNIYTYGEGPKNGIRLEERFFPLTLSLDITEACITDDRFSTNRDLSGYPSAKRKHSKRRDPIPGKCGDRSS